MLRRILRRAARPSLRSTVQHLSDPLFLTLAVIAVVLLGLAKGGFFGLGVMALPVLSLAVHPLHAAAILVVPMFAQDVLTVWTYRRDWSAWNLKIMIPAMMAGIAGATFVVARLEPHHIRLAVGLIAAAFVLRHWLAWDRLTVRPTTGTGILFGGLGGITTMLANAGGPLWQIHLLPQRMAQTTYVGTVTILFAFSNVLKIPSYTALGVFTFDNVLMGAMLVPVAMLANGIGIWLARRTPVEMFYRIAYALMALIALELIRSSVVTMLA